MIDVTNAEGRRDSDMPLQLATPSEGNVPPVVDSDYALPPSRVLTRVLLRRLGRHANRLATRQSQRLRTLFPPRRHSVPISVVSPPVHIAQQPENEAPSDCQPKSRFPIGHYYSPMYDTNELARRHHRLWPTAPDETPGMDWRDAHQLSLCRDAFAPQRHMEFNEEPSGNPADYYILNDYYPPLDAWVLEAMLRHFQPRNMIEVGSGFSTLVSARVNRELLGGQTHLTCIEPNPRQFLLDGVPGVSALRVEQVQDTPLDLFTELHANDVLFIDTSHVVKTGGDVTWLYHEILPRLSVGVVVHIHDVFLPREYPESWVMEGWGWNEAYLVRSFLSFNHAFEIIWGTQYMLDYHKPELFAAFPCLNRYGTRGGSSFWIRRRS